MKYYVTFKVDGRYVAEVEADSIEEAKKLGRDEYMDADFNKMDVIFGQMVTVEDEEDIVWEA